MGQVQLLAPPRVSSEEPSHIKQTFFNTTVNNIDAVLAPPSAKSNILATRFPYAHHISEAENRLRNLLGRTVGHASTIDLSHVSFTFQDIILRNSSGAPIPMVYPPAAPGGPPPAPDVDPNDLPPDSRTHGRYLSLKLRSNVALAYVGEEEEKVKANFKNGTFQVAIQLPLAEDGSIHAEITRQLLLDPRELLSTIKRLDEGQEPVIGTFKVVAHNPMQLDPEGFQSKFETHVAENVYRLHKAILQREFLGNRAVEPSQFIRSLLNVKQLQVDRATGRFYLKTVDQFHTEFTQVLSTWDPAKPLPLDAVQIFWSNLGTDIQNKALSGTYTIPQRPPPEQDSFDSTLNRLRVVKEKAHQFASEVKETTGLVQRAMGRSAQRNPRDPRPNAPMTLVAQTPTYYAGAFEDSPGTSPYETHLYAAQPQNIVQPQTYASPAMFAPPQMALFQDFPEQLDSPLEDTSFVYAAQPSPYEPDIGAAMQHFVARVRAHMASTTPSAASNQGLAEDAVCMAIACASLAEEALKKATGGERPPIECWGCANHPNPEYRATRFHRFFDCPRKAHDPTVREAGEAKLREFMEARRARRQQQRKSSPYGPSNTAVTDDEATAAGHHSAVAANLVKTIATPDTTPDVRMACYKELKENLAGTSVTALHAGAKRKTGDDNGNPKDPKDGPTPEFAAGSVPDQPYQLHFMPDIMPAASVMQTMVQQHRVHLDVTQVLPHIRLPVGNEGKASLFAMVDSGAGLNLGRLQYHQSIAERFPELVDQFVLLKDSTMQEFGLGQVGEGAGPRVTAVISYKTPFIIDGRKTSVAFGLSDSVTCNTIVGFPFLKKADAIPMFGSNVLILQKLGKTLNMDYQQPPKADAAPQTTHDCQMFTIVPELKTHVEVLKSAVAASVIAQGKLTPGAFGSPEYEAFLKNQGPDRS